MKFKLLFLSAFISFSAFSQKIVQPSINIEKSSFAIFVDDQTFANCEQSISDYKKVLEEEGLPTFIVSSNWPNPESVKAEIQKLYNTKKLEGVVFVGDIPIALIRKAQHMTSAFKMDEKRYPMRQSSVPSDRFYDDLDLKFDFLKQDSVQSNFFYYNLSADSPQSIQSDIYSGRIKPIKSGKDSYQQINDYLAKVVREHKAINKLDQFVSYTGHGSYSNSLTAWRSEMETVKEQFPFLGENGGQAKFLRYSFQDYMKEQISSQLRRDDLDFMVFHEHGLPERQYLSEIPTALDFESGIASMQKSARSLARRRLDKPEEAKKLIAERAEKYSISQSWFDGYDDPKRMESDSIEDLNLYIELDDVTKIAPNARFVIFDACYNGDFREDDHIAGRYIFADGKTVATLGNSVNVLQDKSANDLLGLLGMGMRAGKWAQLTNILESHITGDPTFRFTPDKRIAKYQNLVGGNVSNSEWLKVLKTSPYADIQALALQELHRQNYSELGTVLYDTYKSSPFYVVRYRCLDLLEQLNHPNFREVLKLGVKDSYEFVRRISIHRMGKVGLDEFLPLIVDAYGTDWNSERVVFNVEMALMTYDVDKIKTAIEQSSLTPELKEKLLNKTQNSYYGKIDNEILKNQDKPARRIQSIKALKNINRHEAIDDYLKIVQDKAEPEDVRIAMLETLAWYRVSYRKPLIEKVCRGLIDDSSQPASLRSEALRTLNCLY